MSEGQVKTSLRVNNDVSLDDFINLAQAAEAAGFDEIWVSNDLFLRSAPVMLAVAARETRRIGLGTCILNPYSIHPAEVTMMAATLQEAAAGRFRLGIGAGADEFLAWAGIERSQPLARTREAVLSIRALLSGSRPATSDVTSARWQDDAYLRFPASPTPIYVGGMSPRMLRMAGEVADGVLPLLFPPEHFATARAQVQEGADRVGRSMAEIDLAACIWCSIDDDDALAKGALAAKIAYYGPSFAPYLLHRAGLSPTDFDPVREALHAGDLEGAALLVTPRMLTLGIAGSADMVTRRCLALVDAGARHVSFGPPLGPEPLRAVRTLGTQVLPRLRVQSAGEELG